MQWCARDDETPTYLPADSPHQRVRPVGRLFDVDDGPQVELELAYVPARPLELVVEQHVAVPAVERLVEAVLGAHHDQRAPLR